MTSANDDPLFQALRECKRIPATSHAQVESSFSQFGNDPARLAEELNKLGVVSYYQYRKIQIGRTFELFFGDFLVMAKIGEGGMGKVYQAIRRPDALMVALKVVRPQLLSNKTVMKRYEREARAAQQLDHPNVVKLIDSGDINGKYYMAMEFVDGSDLARLVKENGPLPYPEACEYIRQAALGLQHAHNLKFVHRDIKPSNMLVSGTRATVGTVWNANVKILDMGLVRTLDDDLTPDQTELTRDGTVVGTPDYMSPEQGKNSREVDSRADIYSLGCTLYYLLRGQAPYPKGNPIDKLIAHQIDPVPDVRSGRPDIPPMLGDIVSRMMRKQPRERYQTAAEVAEVLASFTPDAMNFDLAADAFSFDPVEPVAATSPPPVALTTPTSSAKSSKVQVATTTPIAGVTPSPGSSSKPTVATKTEVKTAKALPPRPTAQAAAIPKPIGVPDSSESLPSTKAAKLRTDTSASTTRRTIKKARRTKPKFPILPVAAAIGLALALIGVAAYVFIRAGRGTSDANPTTPVTPPTGTPVTIVPTRRPVANYLPAGTAAVLVTHPRSFFELAATYDIKTTSRYWLNLEFLTKRYRFDPRKFDRGIVAFDANPTKVVAVGEGDFLTPDWIGEFNRTPRLSKATSDAQGITQIQFSIGPTIDRNRGVVLTGPPAYLLSHEDSALKDLVARATAEPPAFPPTVNPLLLEALTQEAKTPALATFVATSDFQIPGPTGVTTSTTLGSLGVQGFILTLRMAKTFQVELTLIGKSQERITDFLNVALPNRFERWHPELKPLVEALLKARPTEDLHPVGYRLTARGEWTFEQMQTAWEKLLPILAALKKDKD